MGWGRGRPDPTRDQATASPFGQFQTSTAQAASVGPADGVFASADAMDRFWPAYLLTLLQGARKSD